MSDIVKRLRSDSAFDRLNGARSESGLSGKAADRIEHLERVLSEVRDLIGMAENGARRDAIAAIDEALKS